MLEKNKDYVEFTLQCTTVERTRDKDYRQVCLNGYSDYDFPGVPMDVVCKEFGHKVVMISKRDFDRLQTENEQLKKKLNEFDPVLERFLKYTCGGQGSVSGWEESAKFWKKRYDDIFKLVGFSSNEEVEDYLVNEAECDTLQEAISKLKDQVKYTCDEWYSANSRNNSWKAAAECNSPKELIEKRETLEGKVKALETEAEVYSRALKEWKEITGCPSPSAAKTLIESGMSYVSAYHEVQEENRKLIDDINSWKNVTGYSIPEEFLSAMINNKPQSLYFWQKATGCKTPEEAKSAIRYYKARLGNAVQSASIAMKMLGNSVQSEANAMEILEAISYIDPIKED